MLRFASVGEAEPSGITETRFLSVDKLRYPVIPTGVEGLFIQSLLNDAPTAIAREEKTMMI